MSKTKKVDPEMQQFVKDLRQSIGEMKRGEFAGVHTPAQIAARKRGRPLGSVKADAKVTTTIRTLLRNCSRRIASATGQGLLAPVAPRRRKVATGLASAALSEPLPSGAASTRRAKHSLR
jgi:hypothetical protein